MSKTLTLEGDLATVDAKTLITTQGSVTAPSLVVLAGVTKIDRILVAAAAEGLADGSAVFFIRLGGNSVQNGEQTIMVSAGGRIAVQTGSDAAPQVTTPLVIDNADIKVTASDTISVSAEMAGSDLGTGHVVITLIFA
jgi:hypothetical protein